MQDPRPAPEPATIDETLRLALETLNAVAASWPPNVRLVVRLIDAIIRLTVLQLQLSGSGEADSWKASAMEVVEEIRQTLAMRGETGHAS